MTDDDQVSPLSPDAVPPTDPPSGYQYFAALPRGYTRARPAGVVRRSRDGDRLDQAFTRDLRWEPTTALRDHEYGDGYDDYVEITPDEVEAFVRDVTAKLGG